MSEISDAKNEHLPVYWVKVPVLYHRKTKRALHQYAGYIVSAPARETSPGKFTPIETFQELERFRGGGGGSTGQGDDGTSEKAEEFKKLEQYFARDKRTIRGGVKDGRVKPSSLRDTSNLCDLEVLEKDDITYQIRQRYYKDKIYTYIGAILVAVNPYRHVHFVEGPLAGSPVSGDAGIKLYLNAAGGDFKALPPHIYAIAARAFTRCASARQNQAVIISGESGSGKTVTTKLVLRFLQTVSSAGAGEENNNSADGDAKTVSSEGKKSSASIEAKIGFTNPILESFGNAKTLRNNNSSRFGKWMEILFDKGKIVGANIEQYLLEKSRVVSLGPGERNYHILYMVCRYIRDQGDTKQGAWLKQLAESADCGYRLSDFESGSVRYLMRPGGEAMNYSAEGWDDAAEMRAVLDGMKSIGLWQHKSQIFSVVACVLHLGNIRFTGSRDQSSVDPTCDATVRHCAALLHTQESKLRRALTQRLLKVGRESVWKNQGVRASEKSRDAMAKHAYKSLFGWVVNALASRLHEPDQRTRCVHVGVLDIFGFEDFVDENYFEQLCINYANERLQGHFNKHIFADELKTYKAEGVPKKILQQIAVRCPDNQKTLDLLKFMSDILNEGSNLNPTPVLRDMFLEKKLEKKFGSGGRSGRSRSPSRRLKHSDSGGSRTTGSEEDGATTPRAPIAPDGPFELTRYQNHFCIHHFAGRIEYRYDGMLDRNNDRLNPSLLSAAQTSESSWVRSLFEPLSLSRTSRKTKKKGKLSIMKRFHLSLKELMAKISKTEPQYVRCLKPNAWKEPKMFQTSKVLEQMNCAGLFEAVKIRKSGFPNRMPLARFIKNFAPVIPDRARKRAFERHGDNSRSRAKVLAALMTRYMRRDGGGTGTAGPKQYFIGSRLVLMRSEYWTAIHRHRRKAMKSQFVKAINSRDINLLKSAVGRAKELDLGFPEAVTARKLLDFLQLEAKIVSDRAPAARACVRLKSFSAAREGILRGLKAALLPVQKVIGFDSPMTYIARGGKWAARLAKAWKGVEDRGAAIRAVTAIEVNLQKHIPILSSDSEAAELSFASKQPLQTALEALKLFPSDLRASISETVKSANELVRFLGETETLTLRISADRKAITRAIAAAAASPSDASLEAKVTEALNSLTKSLKSVKNLPLASRITVKEAGADMALAEKDAAYARVQLGCLRSMGELTRRIGDPDFKSSSRSVLMINADVEELKSLNALPDVLRDGAVRCVGRWARGALERARSTSVGDSKRGDGSKIDSIETRIKSYDEAIIALKSLALAPEFGLDAVVSEVEKARSEAETKLKNVAQNAKSPAQREEARKALEAATQARGGLRDAVAARSDAVASDAAAARARGIRRGSIVGGMGSSSDDVKTQRERALLERVTEMRARIRSSQAELNIASERLGALSGLDVDEAAAAPYGVEFYRNPTPLSHARILQLALRAAVSEGRLPEIASVYRSILRDETAAASLEPELHETAEAVVRSLQASEGSNNMVRVYRDLVCHHLDRGDRQRVKRFQKLHSEARRAMEARGAEPAAETVKDDGTYSGADEGPAEYVFFYAVGTPGVDSIAPPPRPRRRSTVRDFCSGETGCAIA